MENSRVSAVIIRDKKILLIKRIKRGEEYYVFPGGGVEAGEILMDATRREIKEELSLDAKIGEELFRIQNQNKEEIFFLVKEFSGVPEIGGPEKERMSDGNRYAPEWKTIDEFQKLENIYPAEAKQKIVPVL